MKGVINKVLNVFGVELRRVNSHLSRTGFMSDALMHLKDQGFNCKVVMDVGANKGNWSTGIS